MNLAAFDAVLRTLLFGGSFLFTLAIVAFIAWDGRERWPEIFPWLALGLTASGLTLPALGFSLLRLGARFQSWVTPLGCIALSGVPLAVLTIGLYAALSHGEAPVEEEVAEAPPEEAVGARQPYFQPVCRNPSCRAPMTPDQKHCPVCGWDRDQPVKLPDEMAASAPAPEADAVGAAETIPIPAYLIVRNGPQAGEDYRLGRETDIGSGPGNHVALKDPFVGREHATVRRKGEAYVFYDMSTPNGSHLITPTGKERLDVPYTLRHGDMIQLGDTVLVFMQVK